jgi:pantoate--beta-alanine ligase
MAAAGPTRLVRTVPEMRREALMAHALSRRIAFVPTMGALHAGHVSLLEEARTLGDLLVLSIFVNPTQFGPNEDLSRYPRTLEADLEKARAAGVDLVFQPTPDEMYPDGYQTFVEVRELQQGMCGASRPGHFSGVATVVLKLLHIVQPHVALFGEKDYQQLQLLKRMARDLDLPVAIVGMPIVREPDGLALSSRNAYLSPEERSRALALSRSLAAARERFIAGERQAAALVAAARAVLDATDGLRLDYLELRDAESLATVEDALARPAVLAVAAFVGKTRLIDNALLRD